MESSVATYSLIHRRRARALFSPGITQQVKSLTLAREIARALLAVTGIASWGALLFLLAT